MHDDDEPLTPSEPDEAPPLPEELAELVSEARKKVNVAAANLQQTKTAHDKAQTIQLSAGELAVKLADLGPVDKAGVADTRAKAVADTKAAEEAVDDAKNKAAVEEAAAGAKAKAGAKAEAVTDARSKAADEGAADTKTVVAATEEAVADARAKMVADVKAAEVAEEAAAVAEEAVVDARAKTVAETKAGEAKAVEEAAADTKEVAAAAEEAAADTRGKAAEKVVAAEEEGSADTKAKTAAAEEAAADTRAKTVADAKAGLATAVEEAVADTTRGKAVDEVVVAVEEEGSADAKAKAVADIKDQAVADKAAVANEKKGKKRKNFRQQCRPVGEEILQSMMPEEWREKLEEEIWKELVKFNNTAPEEKYSISISNHRLLQKVAEILPACATMSRMTTKHFLSNIDNFTHCRFHEEKRTTVQAKQVSGWTSSKFAVDSALVAFEKQKQKKAKKKGGKSDRPDERPAGRLGFLDCGCDEDTVLSNFMWFKTWKVKSTNPNFLVKEGMKNDMFSARHCVLFSQAFSSQTCLQIEDFFSTNPVWGTPEYEIRLRFIQVER
ncbi:hypothetical protein DFH08DRAFT_951371 [Mycena albidolilacea]|uniref:Uncharacterized protein n=1 Tax=Mycena albidolilacea TaxID=1033008 RepID=A0AAD7EZ74_9AGAR|nr:hypothetical protein DFH08DRAFT_951371 [Mycena albidolilacea]